MTDRIVESFERRPQRMMSGVLRLDAELLLPPSPTGAAVFAHPYPPMGGSMDNNMVRAACAALARSGLAALRFDFRGVGASDGEFDDGRGEVDDVRAAIEHARAFSPDGRVLAGGYSFGAQMAALAAIGRTDLAGLVLVSLPARLFPPPPLSGLPGPLLIVCGASDAFGDPKAIERSLAGRTDATLVVEPGVDHFWAGAEDRIEAAISAFCRTLGPGRG